ncbi:hypothetical protein [Kangiella shandongensis]|uniref:hypothetical protein n=1 Tax=Kangiella shandongensis TaxID=2763258 RepID=UPI001CBBEF15|nr:hypothetical protein [Kangiella shandongensis]
MNPDHAVDIYSNYVTGEITFIRRRDDSLYLLHSAADRKEIGAAASEAIEPKISGGLPWSKIPEDWFVEWDQLDVVVAWRDGGQLVIATPFCHWGKAPDILINNQPSHLDFGTAIVQQINYAKSKREKGA